MKEYEFNLERVQHDLSLKDYEMVQPIAENLLSLGCDPVKVAAYLFQYGFYYGRKLLRETQKEKNRIKWEQMQRTAKGENESQTSGENEGSV